MIRSGRPKQPEALLQALLEAIYAIVAELGGTWSAEHGIGRLLLAQMRRYKCEPESRLMRAVKAAIDLNKACSIGASCCRLELGRP
jgi:FAD/FMN-containing dehydrogenase